MARVANRPLILAWTLAGAAACGSREPAWFVETARARGLDFEHVRALETRYWFPEIMGSGVGLLDFDDDGDLDVYLLQGGVLGAPDTTDVLVNRLYRNDGTADFEDVTAAAGVGDPGYGMGCACGDADGDGRVDLYVTNVGPNLLYTNRGDGSFADATARAGVGDAGWGTSAAFFDAGCDGDLDLFVVNYLSWSPNQEIVCGSLADRDYCSPNSYDAPSADVLYRNRGDGTFDDVSEAAGITRAVGNGLGISTGDFDGDGRLDVYVANDMMPNRLWVERPDGSYEDRALLAGCAANMDGEAEAGMGAVAVDVENDGDLDLFVTHLREETNTLYLNANGNFSDRTSTLGLASPSLRFTGFGTGFADFDQDGRLDLYVANGAVTRNRPPFTQGDPYAEPDQLFRGSGPDRFEEVLPQGGVTPPLIATSRGAAFGDLDGDGDVDVLVVDSQAPVRLLENVAARGHWLLLRVRLASGAGSPGSDAYGARVRIETPAGVQWRTVDPATSYCSSNDPRVHFGLGAEDAPVEVLVHWLDGTEERFGPLEVDRVHDLVRGAGR